MKANWLILIIPLSIILGFIIGMSFVDAKFDITMDDNTRLAIESLNESITQVADLDCMESKLDLATKCLSKIYELEKVVPMCNPEETYNICAEACFWDGDNNYILDNPNAIDCMDWCGTKAKLSEVKDE